MQVRELLAILEQLKKLYAAGGAKTAEKDIAKIAAGLEPFTNQPIEEFVEKLRSATAPAPKKRAQTAPPDNTVVTRHVGALTAAGTDEAAFAAAFAAVSGDKSVKVPEADAIAGQFTRQQGSFKTKKAALTAIKRAHLERARFENKLRAVS
jgi:hypothetical protein